MSHGCAHGHGAPVTALNHDRRGNVLNDRNLAAAKFARIGLDEELLDAARRRQSGSIVEDSPIAAVGLVPNRIVSSRLGIFRVVHRQVTVAIDRRTEQGSKPSAGS